MTDTTLNRYLASGTAAQRAAFTPAPATPASGPNPSYMWLETDTGDTYAWNFGGSAWVKINAGKFPITSADTGLYRDAANVISERNLTAAQTFRLYNTTDAPFTNYERATMDWATSANIFRIGTEAGGTGVVRPVNAIGPWTFLSGVTVLGVPPTSGTIQAVAPSGGISLALSDNIHNSLYVSHGSIQGVLIGTDSGGSFQLCAGGVTSANAKLTLTASGLAIFGPPTNAYPAVKAVGTVSSFRLGDDSADSSIKCKGITTTGGQVVNSRTITAAGVITVTVDDYLVVINKTVGAASAVNLPAGVTGQVFVIKDGKGDAATNNITITPAAGNIDGAATLVINTNRGVARLGYNGTEWSVL